MELYTSCRASPLPSATSARSCGTDGSPRSPLVSFSAPLAGSRGSSTARHMHLVPRDESGQDHSERGTTAHTWAKSSKQCTQCLRSHMATFFNLKKGRDELTNCVRPLRAEKLKIFPLVLDWTAHFEIWRPFRICSRNCSGPCKMEDEEWGSWKSKSLRKGKNDALLRTLSKPEE